LHPQYLVLGARRRPYATARSRYFCRSEALVASVNELVVFF